MWLRKRKFNDMSPKVSVVMPAYNAEKYVAEAIESILSQTFQDFEFIIIDDSSTDETWSIIQKYSKLNSRIRPYKNESNLKLSKTLNRGIDLASGTYIARMDADDISTVARLEKQCNYMEQHPDVGIVGGAMEIMNVDGKTIGKRSYRLTDEQIRKKIYRYSPFCHPAIMIRSSILKSAGTYDGIWNPAEDYELYFRIGKYSQFANLQDVLLRYRIIPKSMTTGSTSKMYWKTVEIRRKYSDQGPYTMKWSDKVYGALQMLAMYIIPPSWKIRLFNVIRNDKV